MNASVISGSTPTGIILSQNANDSTPTIVRKAYRHPTVNAAMMSSVTLINSELSHIGT